MRAERIEKGVLTLILVIVGASAGAASFSHVHEWTMANSPQGTADWFGWANAVISELVPIGALLTMRQRHRVGRSTAYPMFLLAAAALLSLSAQLAVAKPGVSGWLLSAVPSLAFMGLSKLVLSGAPAGVTLTPVVTPDVAPEPTRVDTKPEPVLTPDQGLPDAKLDPPVKPAARPAGAKRVTARALTSGDRVRAAAAKLPGASYEQIAAKAAVSVSTVRRHLASPSGAPPAQPSHHPQGLPVAA